MAPIPRGFHLGVLAATLTAAPAAFASYEESHITGDEVRITVDDEGAARIAHSLVWRVVAGRPHGFDLVGTEPFAQPEPSATLESEEGQVLPAMVTVVPGRGLHVSVSEPKALRHGQQYRVHLAYGVNLPMAGELTRDGASVRVTWHSPLPAEGYEGAKVTFVLPPALDPPGALVGEGAMRDDGVVSTLKREPDHDEVELVRPHVGRAEDVLWAVRVAAKAFDVTRSPALAPPPLPPRRDVPAGPGALMYTAITLLGLAFAALVAAKERRFDAACRVFGERARGLVKLRSLERAAAAGAALFVGLSLQLGELPLTGAAFVALAMACATLRPPRARPLPRGPGRWLALRPAEAFASTSRRTSRRTAFVRSGAWLVVALGSTLGLWALAERFVAAAQPEAPRVVLLDSVVLLPLFVTGVAWQLPPDRVARAARWLSAIFRRLQKTKALRVSPWGRIPTGHAGPDEVRVLAVPRAPLPGLLGIEVGLAWGRAATSYVPTPEVLVRVVEATAASARLTSLAPDVVPVPGRNPEERVYRLAPRMPTMGATAELVASLARHLVDRRVADAAWENEERRASIAVPGDSPSEALFPVLG